MKGCVDLAEFVDFSCCDSCHEDANKYGLDLPMVIVKGEDYSVCCRGANAWEALRHNDIKILSSMKGG